MLFASPPAHPPPLLSFPTRRSSDLTMHSPDEALIPLLESGASGFLEKSAADRELVDAVRAVAQDRKSTRLNSSHRCISYAVFCLKKKKRPVRHSVRYVSYFFRHPVT